MQAIIVWFLVGVASVQTRPNGDHYPAAAYCTAPASVADTERSFDQVFAMWQAHKDPRFTPPNIIKSDHPNYQAALNECKRWGGNFD